MAETRMTIQTRMILSALGRARPGDEMWGHKLQELTGLSSACVYTILTRLIARGFVSVRERPAPGASRCRNVYELTEAGRELAVSEKPATDIAVTRDANGAEVLVRGKGILDGSSTLDEAIRRAGEFAAYLRELSADGYVLSQVAEDDYMFVRKA
jgi:DNA-binding PadR family transcriptional regulator